jgi:hypothetical protein
MKRKRGRGRPRLIENPQLLCIRIAEKQRVSLHRQNKKTGISICAIIRTAIDEYFERREAKDPDWERER